VAADTAKRQHMASHRPDTRKEIAMPLSDLKKSLILFLGLVLLSSPLLRAGQEQGQAPSPARNPIEGADIFRHYCAACHGVDGQGHGPASVTMKHVVPDLTRISQRNGGTFPFLRVKKVIEGEDAGPLAHGSREMPMWGPIFHEIESDMDLGEVRLEAITKHLASMQQK
jgi:mono/diheme cytochrome c family protein